MAGKSDYDAGLMNGLAVIGGRIAKEHKVKIDDTFIPKKKVIKRKPVYITIINLIIVFLILLVIYIYSALSVQFIAKKTNTSKSWLAWIPIANSYLICKIIDK